MPPVHLRLLCALAFALLAAGCGSSWPALDLASLPDVEEFPDDHVVLLDEEAWAHYGWDEERQEPYYEVEQMRRYRLLTETGRKRLSRYSIGYDEKLSRLSEVRARIVKADGGQVEATEHRDHPAYPGGSTLHASSRVRIVDLSEAKVGDVIELRWREREWTLFMPKSWVFASKYPIVRSTFALEQRPGQEHAVRFDEGGVTKDFEPRIETREGRTWKVWERRDWEPLRDGIALAPATGYIFPRLSVALRALDTPRGRQELFTRWEDFGPWYAKLSEGVYEVTDAVKEAAKRVLSKAPDEPRERVRELFRHLQDDVRYVSIQLGMGGWRPAKADDTASQQFGDCKGMSAYLKSLLAHTGIASEITIVATRDSYPADAGPANLRGANHAILAVQLEGEDGYLFLDPTCRACPFGTLRWDDEATDVLVMHPEGAKVVRTPALSPEDTLIERKIALELDAEGGAAYTVEHTATGHRATSRRSKLFNSNPDEIEDFIHGLAFPKKRRTHESHTVQDLELLDKPLKLKASGRVKAVAEGTQGTRTLSVSDVARRPLSRLEPDRPKIPLHFKYPYTHRVVVEAALPHHEVTWTPPPVTLDTPLVSYRRTVEVGEGRVTLTRELVLKLREVPADEVAAVADILDQVHAHETEGIVLEPRTTTEERSK